MPPWALSLDKTDKLIDLYFHFIVTVTIFRQNILFRREKRKREMRKDRSIQIKLFRLQNNLSPTVEGLLLLIQTTSFSFIKK